MSNKVNTFNAGIEPSGYEKALKANRTNAVVFQDKIYPIGTLQKLAELTPTSPQPTAAKEAKDE